MKKVLIGTLILVFVVVGVWFFVGSGTEKKDGKVEGDITLYYVSMDGTTFCEVPYQYSKAGRAIDMAKEVLKQLKKVPKSEECQPSIPQSVMWSDIDLDDQNLVIDFTSSYSKLTNVTEIFLRASVVKTLVQIQGIDTVEFRMNGTPLLNTDDQPLGAMTADWFIDDGSENWGVTQDEVITLFYVNESGDELLGEEVRLEVSNIPKEQEIIERLIKGSDKEGYYSAIPQETMVLQTVTKNGTCYVDLDEHFLDPMKNIPAEITVYSIVNSLVELSNVNKVQFTINGEKIKKFRGTMEFDIPFERNLDLMGDEQEESIIYEEYQIIE